VDKFAYALHIWKVKCFACEPHWGKPPHYGLVLAMSPHYCQEVNAPVVYIVKPVVHSCVLLVWLCWKLTQYDISFYPNVTTLRSGLCCRNSVCLSSVFDSGYIVMLTALILSYASVTDIAVSERCVAKIAIFRNVITTYFLVKFLACACTIISFQCLQQTCYRICSVVNLSDIRLLFMYFNLKGSVRQGFHSISKMTPWLCSALFPDPLEVRVLLSCNF